MLKQNLKCSTKVKKYKEKEKIYDDKSFSIWKDTFMRWKKEGVHSAVNHLAFESVPDC